MSSSLRLMSADLNRRRQLERIVFQLESAVAKLAEVVQEEAARNDGVDAPNRAESMEKLDDAKFQLLLIKRSIHELREMATREAWEEKSDE